MKTKSCLVALILGAIAAWFPTSGFAQVAVGVKVGKTQVGVAVDADDDDDDDAEPAPITIETFHEALEPYGRWIETVRYGLVWHPMHVHEDWRPYSYGYWECTEMGWVFVSEHPWGWACYHYGRWLNTPDNGWIWIPGTVWAPAWVAWRVGGEHIGWAPLPPDPHYHPASVVIVEERHFSLDFVFVRGGHFCEPARPALFVPREQHVNIVNQTTNITQVNVVNNTVINNGPQITQVQKIVNKPVNVVRVKDVQKTEVNNYTQNIATVAPEKAEKLTTAASAVQKSTNSRVKKVQQTSPEVKQRAAMAVTKERIESSSPARANSPPPGGLPTPANTPGSEAGKQPVADPKKSATESKRSEEDRSPSPRRTRRSTRDRTPDDPGRAIPTKQGQSVPEPNPAGPPDARRRSTGSDTRSAPQQPTDATTNPNKPTTPKTDNLRNPPNLAKDSRMSPSGKGSPQSSKDLRRPGSEKDSKDKESKKKEKPATEEPTQSQQPPK